MWEEEEVPDEQMEQESVQFCPEPPLGLGAPMAFFRPLPLKALPPPSEPPSRPGLRQVLYCGGVRGPWCRNIWGPVEVSLPGTAPCAQDRFVSPGLICWQVTEATSSCLGGYEGGLTEWK